MPYSRRCEVRVLPGCCEPPRARTGLAVTGLTVRILARAGLAAQGCPRFLEESRIAASLNHSKKDF